MREKHCDFIGYNIIFTFPGYYLSVVPCDNGLKLNNSRTKLTYTQLVTCKINRSRSMVFRPTRTVPI